MDIIDIIDILNRKNTKPVEAGREPADTGGKASTNSPAGGGRDGAAPTPSDAATVTRDDPPPSPGADSRHDQAALVIGHILLRLLKNVHIKRP